MLKLKNWHYLNYKHHFYLWVQQKTNVFLDVYGRFWKFQEVSQSCNMLQLSVEQFSSVCRYVLTIISAKILHKCDETSLTVTRIAVSLTLKWEVALKAGSHDPMFTQIQRSY